MKNLPQIYFTNFHFPELFSASWPQHHYKRCYTLGGFSFL